MSSPAMPAHGHAPTPCPRRETPQVTDTKDNTSNAKASKEHTPLMKHYSRVVADTLEALEL